MNEWLVSCVPPWSRYRMRGHSTEHNHKQHMQGQGRTTLGHRLYEKNFASDSPVLLRFLKKFARDSPVLLRFFKEN